MFTSPLEQCLLHGAWYIDRDGRRARIQTCASHHDPGTVRDRDIGHPQAGRVACTQRYAPEQRYATGQGSIAR